MPITSEQQLDIINVCGGFFNAAPGQTFLNEFIAAVEAGATIEQLASAFESSSVFTSTILNGQTSASSIVAVLMNNYGLTIGNTDPASADAQAEAFFTAKLESGASVTSIIIEATNYLNGTVDPIFISTQNLYINKGMVSQAYSATKFSNDVSVLQGVLEGLTGDTILTQEEVDEIVANAAGETVLSYTLTSDVTSSGLAEGVAATFTFTASKPVEEDTVITFTVVPGDTSAADQGTGSTNVNDFPSGTFNPQTVTIPAGETTATFFMSGQSDGITELPETFSVQAAIGEETWSTSVKLIDGGATTTLTTNQDNVVGSLGNDTINGLVGTGATFTLGDNIDGNDGHDTLRLTTDSANVNLGIATISNVENLIVNSRGVGPTAATTLNVGGNSFDEVTSQGVEGVDGGADTFVISNIETSSDLTLEDIADVATTVNYNSVSGSNDHAHVTIKGAVEDATNAGENDLTIAGIETLDLMFANGNNNTIVNDLDTITATAAKTVNMTVYEDSATMIRGGAQLGAATALNIDASSNLTLLNTAQLANDAVITVTGYGDVDLNTLDDNGATNGVTVNATEMTGGLTATTGANTVSVNTGSGDDVITMGATVTTAVSTGDGDDIVGLGANDQGSSTSNAIIDGGDGHDTLGITVAANFDAATLAKAINFETLALGGANAGTYSMKDKGFSGVLFNSNTAANGVIVSGITNETLSFADTGNADVLLVNNHVTFALDDATGTSDTIEIDITGAQSTAVFGHPGGAGTEDTTDDTNDITLDEIVIADVETVTLSSNTHEDNVAGTANVLGSISTNATALNITGNHALNILTFDTEVAGTDASNVSLTTIDASASGGLIMGEHASTQTISILGSEFADTLVVDVAGSTINAGGGSDSITMAAGALDTLIINAGDSQIGYVDADGDGSYDEGEELHDTVVGFVSGEDTLDLGSYGFTGQKASALAAPALTAAQALDLIDGTTTSITNFFVATGVQRGVAVVSGDFDNIDGTGDADDATNDTLVFIDTNGNGHLDVGTDEMIELTGTANVVLADFGF